MNIIVKKNWDYIGYEKDEKIYLEVLVGTSISYDVTVELTIDQANKVKEDTNYFDIIAKEIRKNPKKYMQDKKNISIQ